MRVIVVGIDGLVGGALATTLSARGNTVYGTTRRASQVRPGRIDFLDLAEPTFDLPPADVAFICAAMTSLAACRAQPTLAERTNLQGPAALAAWFAERGVRTIFLSTNAVFDCQAPLMLPDRPRVPNSVYGRLKAAAEDAVLARAVTGTVVRLTKILNNETPLLKRWAGALREGAHIEAATDHRIAPVTLDHAVKALLSIAAAGETGLYQVSAAADLSYADVALRLAERLKVPHSRVASRSAIDIGIPREEALPFTSLDTSRFDSLTGGKAPDPYRAVDLAVDAVVGRV